ncbi:hypothetical protein DdX_18789 [Ditylenchus destructor]|uniref:Uncharacterized protein n=1 Tax=Ditylenchus destructor TaxID=166010 RepID=A0AAD4MNV4_9BILA|nr:hypothetical protein DdX_18789 [Ditylenchus destructor]
MFYSYLFGWDKDDVEEHSPDESNKCQEDEQTSPLALIESEDANHNNSDAQSMLSTVYESVKTEGPVSEISASLHSLNAPGVFVCCSNEPKNFHKHDIQPEPEEPCLYSFTVDVHRNGMRLAAAPRLAEKLNREFHSQMENCSLQSVDNGSPQRNSSTPVLKRKNQFTLNMDEQNQPILSSLLGTATSDVPPKFHDKANEISKQLKLCSHYAEKSENVLTALMQRRIPSAKDLFGIEETDDDSDDGLGSISAPVPSMESGYMVEEEDMDELCKSALVLKSATARMKELLEQLANLDTAHNSKAIEQKENSSAKKKKHIRNRPNAFKLNPILRRG